MFTITCLEHCLLLTVKMTVKNILTCGAGWWIQVCKVRTCRGATLKICIKGRTWYTDSVRRLTQLDTPQTRGRQPLCDTTPCLGPRHDTHRHSQCCGASEGFISAITFQPSCLWLRSPSLRTPRATKTGKTVSQLIQPALTAFLAHAPEPTALPHLAEPQTKSSSWRKRSVAHIMKVTQSFKYKLACHHYLYLKH